MSASDLFFVFFHFSSITKRHGVTMTHNTHTYCFKGHFVGERSLAGYPFLILLLFLFRKRNTHTRTCTHTHTHTQSDLTHTSTLHLHSVTHTVTYTDR